MCSVSWIYENEGYCIVANRDELRSRLPAVPPRTHRDGSVCYIAPIDGNAGGTWIAADDQGRSILLFNHYPGGHSAMESVGSFQSRGSVIPAFLTNPASLLTVESLAVFKPFDLLVFAPDQNNRRYRWNGKTLVKDAIVGRFGFLTTSSIDNEGVSQIRTAVFEDAVRRTGKVTEMLLRAVHASHLPEKGGLSICMHRKDARTFSWSIIRVDQRQVSFEYMPDSPCRAAAGQVVRLPVNHSENRD